VSVNIYWLEERNINITEELSRIADLFSDFKFVNEIREELEKVNYLKRNFLGNHT
jgi:hypothetical protein